MGGAGARLAIRPAISLVPHQETNPTILPALTRSILQEQIQRRPVLVDNLNGIVLDGAHRLAALKALGAANIVCEVVDYSSDQVQLRNWVRILKGFPRSLLFPFLESIHVDQPAGFENAFELVEKRKVPIAIVSSRDSFVASQKLGSVRDSMELVRTIDRMAASLGCRQEFVEEKQIDLAISSESQFAILVPAVRKNEVIDAGRTGRIFPSRTTIHSMRPEQRPVDYPLAELKRDRPLKAIERR